MEVTFKDEGIHVSMQVEYINNDQSDLTKVMRIDINFDRELLEKILKAYMLILLHGFKQIQISTKATLTDKSGDICDYDEADEFIVVDAAYKSITYVSKNMYDPTDWIKSEEILFSNLQLYPEPINTK